MQGALLKNKKEAETAISLKLGTSEATLPKEITNLISKNLAVLTGYYSFEYLGERKWGILEIGIKIMKIVDTSDTAEGLLGF